MIDRPIREERYTTRQQIDIAFSRFLDATEDDDHDAIVQYATRLADLGVHLSFQHLMVRQLRAERATSIDR